MEAYKNEVDLVRGDLKNDLESKEKQLKVLQQTVQNLQKVKKERSGKGEVCARDFILFKSRYGNVYYYYYYYLAIVGFEKASRGR